MYGVHVWFPLIKECEWLKLSQLQKRIIRIISAKNVRAHCMPLFKEAGILRLDDLVYLENLKLQFRVRNLIAPKPIENLFPKLLHNYNTRRVSLEIPRHILAKFNNSFLVKSVTLLDSLTNELKGVQNIKLFAKRIKKNIIERY